MTVREFLELFTKKDLWDNIKVNKWEEHINVFYGLIVPMRLLNGDKDINCFKDGEDNKCNGTNAIYQWSSVFNAIYNDKGKGENSAGAEGIEKTHRLGMKKSKWSYTTYKEHIAKKYNRGLSSNVPIKVRIS